MNSTDYEELVEHLKLIQKAKGNKSHEDAHGLEKMADFSLGVMCTSAAQALGLSFQASALNMQSAFMTNQAAAVRGALEEYRGLACSCGSDPCRCGQHKKKRKKRKHHRNPPPFSAAATDAKDLRQVMETLLDALDEAKEDPLEGEPND